MRPWLREVLMGIGALGLIGIFLFPWGEETKEQAKRRACLSNVKQRSLALIMYAEDSGERFPMGVRWMDATASYLKQPSDDQGFDRTLRCPAVFNLGFGYAFNSGLSQEKSPSRPEATPLIYDSTQLGRNAVDRFTSLPRPARHEGRDNVADADGHAKSIKVP